MNGESIKKFLSLPVVSAIVIIIAILIKIFFQFYFLNIDNDKSYQILAAQNFLNGNGFSLLEVSATDLSSQQFVPLIKWPPGYSLLLAPFLAFLKNNAILATLLLDALSCILFIVYARKLLFANSLPVWLVNIYTLIAGFFFYSFCTASSSDFITLTVFVIALYYSLKVFQSNKLVFRRLLVIAVLLFLTAFIRYMYIPVALALPACFVITGIFNNNRLLLKKGTLLLGLTSIFIVIFLLLQHTYGDSAVYIRDADKGFYVSNLQRFHPVVFSSILNLDFTTTTLSTLSGRSFESISRVISVLHFIALFLVLAIVIKWFIRKKMMFISVTDIYLSIGISISLVIALTLIALSLRNSLYIEYGYGGWTYVQEGRYFAFMTFFLQQTLFILAYQYRNAIQKWVRMLLVSIIFISGLDMLHNMYYSAKVLLNQKTSMYNTIKSIRLLAYTDQITKKTIAENPGKKVIVISRPAHFAAQAGFYQSIPALYIYTPMQHVEIKTKEPVKVLFITTDLGNMPVSFANNPSMGIAGNFNKYTFYTVDVEPDQP